MPTTIAPDNPATFPANIAGPADGEPANAASVNVALQAFMNGVEAARLAGYGARHTLRAKSTNGTHVVVEPMGQLQLTSAGLWRTVGSLLQTSFSAATKLGAALANSTRYYVYAGIVGGALDFLVSTDPPEATLAYRNGSTDWAFVTTFATDSAGVIIPYVSSGATYRYLSPAYLIPADLTLVNVTTNTVAVVTNFGVTLPPQARVAHLVANFVGVGSWDIGAAGVTASGWSTGGNAKSLVGAFLGAIPIDVPLGTNGFRYETSGGTTSFTLVVAGFSL